MGRRTRIGRRPRGEGRTAEALLNELQQDQLTDHEQRLRALERFQWKVVGALAVTGGLGALLGKLLGGQ